MGFDHGWDWHEFDQNDLAIQNHPKAINEFLKGHFWVKSLFGLDESIEENKELVIKFLKENYPEDFV
jgi:hypothetical protein